MAQSPDADARMPKGTYANYFEVGHTAFEIVIDFGQRYAQSSAPCHTRIVTSPIYARALLQTLADSLEQYTAAFGAPSEPTHHGDLPSD